MRCPQCGKPMIATSRTFMQCPDAHGNLVYSPNVARKLFDELPPQKSSANLQKTHKDHLTLF